MSGNHEADQYVDESARKVKGATKYVTAVVLGLAAGAVLGYLLGAVVGLSAMALVPYQDTPPDYAYVPFLVGIVGWARLGCGAAASQKPAPK